MPHRNEQTRLELIEAIQTGYSIAEMRTLIGCAENQIYNLLKELVDKGKIRRVAKGKYEVIPLPEQTVPPPRSLKDLPDAQLVAPTAVPHVSTSVINPYDRNGNGKSNLAQRSERKVQLPEYMKGRTPITLYVEYSAEELEGVMRFELCVSGVWLALPVTGDLRVCLGDRIPDWTPTREFYYDVQAFRVTRRDGTLTEYPHNPTVPVTVDRKIANA